MALLTAAPPSYLMSRSATLLLEYVVARYCRSPAVCELYTAQRIARSGPVPSPAGAAMDFGNSPYDAPAVPPSLGKKFWPPSAVFVTMNVASQPPSSVSMSQ